jgi:hypothetical protein
MGGASVLLTHGVIDHVTDRRGETRHRVIKRAQIIFQNSVIDCTVLDVSTNGARVRTNAIVITPEQVIVQFRGGGAFFARRRWSRGMEMSFVFDRPAPLNQNAALVALSAFEALSAKGLEEAVRILRVSGFFDDPVLGQAAEEAEAAYARFETALRARVISRRA